MSEPASAFSNDAQSVIQRTVQTISQERGCSIEEYYELEETVKDIKKHGYKKIALQFPDEMLPDSAYISQYLRTHTLSEVFILGDTSYGCCCVDEVAAEHANADFLIHYGNSCQSPASRTSVRYVYGKRSINAKKLVEACQKTFSAEENFILLYNYAYADTISSIGPMISKAFPNAIIPDEPQKSVHVAVENEGVVIHKEKEEDQPDKPTSDAFTFVGREWHLPEGKTMEQYKILFISPRSTTLTNLMLSFNKTKVYTYEPKEDEITLQEQKVNRLLMKRYYLVEKAKDAQVIGILVGTLSVSRFMDIIEHVKSVIKSAGKKHYVLVVGKLNVAKLANFLEIDIFVYIACPETVLVLSSDYLKPIITPFELELALVRGKEWDGSFVTNFVDVLKNKDDKEITEDEDEDELRFSLVDGRLHSNHKQEGSATDISDETQLATRSDGQLINVPLGSQRFLERSFRGLERRLGDTPATKAVQGETGVAWEYKGEGGSNDKKEYKSDVVTSINNDKVEKVEEVEEVEEI